MPVKTPVAAWPADWHQYIIHSPASYANFGYPKQPNFTGDWDRDRTLDDAYDVPSNTLLESPVTLMEEFKETDPLYFVGGGTPSCPYDFNNDGVVDILDINIVIAHSIFNNAPYDPTYDVAPVGGDGAVDIADIFVVAANVGRCP